MELNEVEIEVLRFALKSYPRSVLPERQRDEKDDEYVAFCRLSDAGLLESNIEPPRFPSDSVPRFRSCKITEPGREAVRVWDEDIRKRGPQHRDDEPVMFTLGDCKKVVIQHIRHVETIHNQISVDPNEVKQVMTAIDEADSDVVKRAIKEWLPQSIVQTTVGTGMKLAIGALLLLLTG